jgi:hypothetical protein
MLQMVCDPSFGGNLRFFWVISTEKLAADWVGPLLFRSFLKASDVGPVAGNEHVRQDV